MTEIDLSPRPAGAAPPSRKRIRNWLVVGLLVGALGFVTYKALSSATVFFYHVDEAIQRQVDLGDRTFRMHGVVVSEPATDASGALVFELAYNEATTTVRHIGAEPTDLFELGIPVVAEGRWGDRHFVSNQLLIKHSEAYIADNPDNVDLEIEQRLDQG